MRKLSANIMTFLQQGAEPHLDPLEESVTQFEELDASGNSVPIKRYRNLTYFRGEPRDAIRHKLDIYIPAQNNPSTTHTNLPLIIFIHGGAWRIGSKDDLYGLYGRIARKFAANNIPFANINYRLTPRVKHPGHIEDVANALAWLHANAQHFNCSPNQFFMMGHSSGAQLASLLTLDHHYLAQHNLNATSLINGVIALSGVFNPQSRTNLHTPTPDAKTSPVFTPQNIKNASPINLIHPNSPPFLLIHETIGDEMIRETKQFSEKLQQNKINHQIISMAQTDHISMLTQLIREQELQTFNKIISFIKQNL